MPAHTSGFRVLLCFAMASNRILWFARARARQYYGTWILPSKLDTLADLAGCFGPTLWAGWLQLACLFESAYPVRAQQDMLSLCQLNSYQKPFKSRALGCSSIGPKCRCAGAGKACFAVDLGFNEIHVDTRAGDVMVGVWGAAGPAPDVRHQPPGTTVDIYYILTQLINTQQCQCW